MRAKEINTIESLNQHINAGWRLVRAYDKETIIYLMVKDDSEAQKDDKRSENNR